MKTCRKGHQYEGTRCQECKNALARAEYRNKPALQKAREARWRARNPEKYKAHYQKHNAKRRGHLYGLSAEEYAARIAKSCDICGHKEKRVMGMHVDHDHETGRLRGTLCHGCNVGLGAFDDSTPRMLAAIQYLAMWS